MAITYEVRFKSNNETVTLDINGLKNHIEAWFTKITPRVHQYIFNKITNSKTPFENSMFVITPSNVELDPKRPKLPGVDAPKSATLEIASRKNINYWTVYDTKTDKSVSFNSLAALARAFNVQYSFLYSRVRYASSYSFGNLVLTYNTVLEKLDSAEKLRGIK